MMSINLNKNNFQPHRRIKFKENSDGKEESQREATITDY